MIEGSYYLDDLPGTPVVAAEVEASKDRPRAWLSNSAHLVGGIYIPFLPEPRSTETGQHSRSEVFDRYRDIFGRAFHRVLQLVAEPHVWRDSVPERDKPFWTFDLRICTGLHTHEGVAENLSAIDIVDAPLRTIVLIKGVLQSSSGESAKEVAKQTLRVKIEECIQRFQALTPIDLTTYPVRWASTGPPVVIKLNNENRRSEAWVRPETVGVGAGHPFGAEIRRALAVSLEKRPRDLGEYRTAIKEMGPAAPLPLEWPESSPDLLATVTAMLASRAPTVLSVRVQPTRLTGLEMVALGKRLQDIASPTTAGTRRAVENLQNLIRQRDLFQCTIQVASADPAAVTTVIQSIVAEHTIAASSRRATHRYTRNLAVIQPLGPDEETVAEYNMRAIESLAWGIPWIRMTAETKELLFEIAPGPSNQRIEFCDPPVDGIDQPPRHVRYTASLPRAATRLQLPDIFLERDIEDSRALTRIRSLFTLNEVFSIWRLPVVPPGGFPGLQSRYPNPFEQLPEPTPKNGDSISLGYVQRRGLDTQTEFRVPLLPNQNQFVPGVAGVGDRSIVVAGSPGSGKTNFCLWFLKQLWSKDPSSDGRRNRPYLVIDPTRGNEFRALMETAGEEMVVFTVGDSRVSPFCFNPFQVPRKVSVQSHISRLMSCFRAAYQMWDPLPAIFELALRRAYEGKRRKWWEEREKVQAEKENKAPREWAAAIDFCKTASEKFPTLRDVVTAMGTGDKDERYEGMPTVMTEQKKMWGGDTENAHTIVASTYLRLKNLFDNYDDIIGGATPNRQCVDLEKLMAVPAVLEFGMIGDSQALSLIMSFMVCALAGTIEGREIPASGEKNMHMLVLEEAHRLLAGEHAGGSSEGSSSKAQAAEDINTMLAEVRKYGQGVLIIDQRPGSLVGGVIDNAYLVALHRLNEEAGFQQFSRQLNLNADQQRYCRSELRPGQMVVLDRRSGVPVLIKPGNLDTDAAKMSDEILFEKMNARRSRVLAQSAAEAAPTAIAQKSTVGRFELPNAVYEELKQALGRFSQTSVGNGRVAAEEFCRVARMNSRYFGQAVKSVTREDRWRPVAQNFVAEFGYPTDTLQRLEVELISPKA